MSERDPCRRAHAPALAHFVPRCLQVVSGKQFVTALRTLITDFGNVDDKFLAKVAAPVCCACLCVFCACACAILRGYPGRSQPSNFFLTIFDASSASVCVRALTFSRAWQVDLLAKESEAVASELFNVNEDMDIQALQDEVEWGTQTDRMRGGGRRGRGGGREKRGLEKGEGKWEDREAAELATD